MSVFDEISQAKPTPPTISQHADGSWWWCDETWTECGPCATREEAVEAQAQYCREVLGI